MEVGQWHPYLIASSSESSLTVHNFDKTTHDFCKMALLT